MMVLVIYVTAKPCSVYGLRGGSVPPVFLWRALDGHGGERWAYVRVATPVLLALAHFRNLPGGGGIRGPTRDGTVVLPTHWLRREVVGEGALRGRSPRTREGRIGPTAQKRGESEEKREERNIFGHAES